MLVARFDRAGALGTATARGGGGRGATCTANGGCRSGGAARGRGVLAQGRVPEIRAVRALLWIGADRHGLELSNYGLELRELLDQTGHGAVAASGPA